MLRASSLCLSWLLAAVAAAVSARAEHVLFAFDDKALPFQHGLRLRLIGFQSKADTTGSNQVIAPGPPGAPDSKGVIYYGTVCQVGEELWMWYLGMGDQDEKRQYRIHLAKSKDGRHWEKP
ncbi:MAG: hypothetical protein JNN01_21815, partial [Opitutaceae bacterium]|nr:hypothetical protein [Opitutaceae bacterium]